MYAAVAADSLKKLKGDSLAILEYELAEFQTVEIVYRMLYYFGPVISLPTAIFDGTDKTEGGDPGTFQTYSQLYEQHMGVNTPGRLALRVIYDPSTRDGTAVARFTSADQIPQSDLALRYAIAESHIYHPWQDLDSLHFIVRDMLPDENGVPVSVDQGETFVDTQSFHIDTSWVDRHCELVAFVQSDQDTAVLISSSLPVYQPHVPGDANSDRVVTVSDAVFLTNYILYGGPGPLPPASGDPNEDCVIDIQDVNYLIDYLYHRGSAPLQGCDMD